MALAKASQGKIVPPRGDTTFGKYQTRASVGTLTDYMRLGSHIRVRGQNVRLSPLGIHDPSTDLNRYAEMTKTEKNKISHRYKALEKLKIWLQES